MRIATLTGRAMSILPLLLLWPMLGCVRPVGAQLIDAGPEERARVLEVAREIMTAAGTCALITVDGEGRARVRTMDAFTPEEDFVVWMGTNPRTRKVAQIQGDPRVSLYYFDPGSQGYVTMAGVAEIVDDPAEKAARFKDGWEAFYPDRQVGYVLIRVSPEWVEVVSESHGVTGDEATWRPPRVTFAAGPEATPGR